MIYKKLEVHKELTRRIEIIGTRGYPSYYGGFETAVRKLSPFLVDNGWMVTVYGRKNSTLNDDPTRDIRVKQRLTWGLERKSLSTITYGLSASFSCVRSKPDVALVMNVANGLFLPLLKVRGIKTLVNVDGIEWQREKWGRLARGIFRLGAWLTAKYADELIFDSREIAKYWKEVYGRDGVFIPYGGEPPSIMTHDQEEFEKGSYVLLVARFVPENSVPEFLEASRVIAEHFPVVLVGSSGYGGAIDESASELADSSPNIHWLGHISDDNRLHALWENAGVYFHGHSVGGTNPTLVQAMALGVPIVARDTVFNREVLGEDGVFVEPTPQDIETAVLDLMLDPITRAKLGTALRRRAEAEYTWEMVCQEYESAARRISDTQSNS